MGFHKKIRYINESGNVQNYTPSLLDGAWTDDDTDFEWFYIYEMQKKRDVFLEYDYITQSWIERVKRGIYCSNRFVRCLMDIGIKPPYSEYQALNSWAEFNASGQFLCETFVLLTPAMPQTAVKISLNYTLIAINGEPSKTTQLFDNMIVAAFIEDNINKILDEGIVKLDSKSIIKHIYNDVKNWHKENPRDWEVVRRLLKEKYTKENNRTRDSNGYELNTGAIFGALLYGNGEFAETLKLAFNLGCDADCNTVTVISIMGTVYGYCRMMTQSRRNEQLWQIVDRYKNTTRGNRMPMNETIITFADHLTELFEIVNEKNGGSKIVENNVLVYRINKEIPTPIVTLPVTDKKIMLSEHLDQQIKDDLNSNQRETRARAVFLAICLYMDEELEKVNSKKWETICNDLSGYWKIIYNIFEQGKFRSLSDFSKKFEKDGFKSLTNWATQNDVWVDRELWKNPKTIY